MLDGDENAANAFLRDFGLQYGTYLNWYVEGTTEWSALESVRLAVGLRGINLVNLRGKVAAGKDALIFADDLADDKRRNIYSFISIDGDRGDRIRAVKRAARERKFFGQFFIAEPDFEFGNFDLAELEEVLWRIVEQAKHDMLEQGEAIEEAMEQNQEGASPPESGTVAQTERERLHDAIQAATSGKQLMETAQRALPYLGHLSKSETWGRELMRYAGEHPVRKSGERRPVIIAVQSALAARGMSYARALDALYLDAATGRLEQKKELPPGSAPAEMDLEA